MDEEQHPFAQNSRPNTNVRFTNRQPEPFDSSSFLRNFDSFPEIFHPDNFFSGRARNSRRNRRDSTYDEYPEEFAVPRNQNGNNTSPNPNRTQSKSDILKKQKEAKKKEIFEAEKNPNSGHYWKKIGNEYYQKGNFEQALEHYTKAIEINDTESVFFSNRARCYKQLKNYKKAYEDAVHAIELDETNIKAHLLCGQTLAEMSKAEPGIDKLTLALTRMTKALTLCAGQEKQDFEKDVYRNMLKTRKLMWYKKRESIIALKVEMLGVLKASLEANESLSADERQKKYQQYIDAIGDPSKPLEQVIPDYLCCKITLDLMEDPVTTSAGHTYDREPLMEHLEKNGYIDPVNREPIKKDAIVPNLNIKQAIDEFIKENPWSFEYSSGENSSNITF